MNFDLTSPCNDCPFRPSQFGYKFPLKRLEEILYSPGGFPCHKTTTLRNRKMTHKKAQMCAGRMILLERAGEPDTVMQISKRLGFYFPEKLNKIKDTFNSIEEFIKERIDHAR